MEVKGGGELEGKGGTGVAGIWKEKEMEVGTKKRRWKLEHLDPLAPSVLSLINIINIFSSNGILCVFVFLSFFFRYNAVGSPVDSAHSITVALRDLYKIMDKTPESLPPIIFLQV